MTRYRLSTPAQLDLVTMRDFTLESLGGVMALKMESDLRDGFQLLAKHLGAGRLRHELTSQDVLFFLVRPYFVIYRQEDEMVVIHAIIHSARDVKTMLERRRF